MEPKGNQLLGFTIEGRYRLDARLGSGGMGDVYRATRLLIGDEVAVKILHSNHAEPNAAERFRREAQAAARIKHPNAVDIYDFGITDEGFQYLVMELVEGVSLRSLIKEQGSLAPSIATEIIGQACMALGEAHRHKIIHRDIKPDNIMVDRATTQPKVKVLDFGIAKLRDDVLDNLTQTGSILGTPHYMSPEQCMGEEIDHRSDIYSLGIVLYEMLTGTVPFRSSTPAAVVVQHVNQPPVPPRSLNVSISPSVQAAVLHALEKQRDRRPQSAEAFVTELANAVSRGGSLNSSDISDNENVSMPTIVIGEQSFQGASAGRPIGYRTARRSNNGASIHRIIVLTVLITVGLLALGGLTFWMLKGTTSGSSSTVDGPRVQNEPSAKQESQLPIESTEPLSTKAFPVSTPSKDVLNAEFTKHLRGAIGRYGIEMTLHRNGNNLSGTYVYTKYRINISLLGSIDVNQNVEMYGYDNNGVQIDVFKGQFVSSSRIVGQWSKPNGTKSLPFTLMQEN